jgi:hypothetical protein
MAMSSPTLRIRTLTFIAAAMLAGVALWLAAPWGSAGSNSTGGGHVAITYGSMDVSGPVQVETVAGSVVRLVVPVTVGEGDAMELGSASGALHAETALADTAAAAVPGTYTLEWLSGEPLTLSPGDSLLITAELPEGSNVFPDNPARLVLRPASDVRIVVPDVLP